MADENARNQKLMEEYEDAIFKIAVEKAVNQIGSDLLEENKRLKSEISGYGPYQKEALEIALKKKDSHKKSSRWRRIVWAASLLIITIAFFSLTPSGEALANKVKQMLITPRDNATVLQLENKDDALPAYWTNCYRPTYIPDHYIAAQEQIIFQDDVKAIVLYNENEPQLFINYSEMTDSGTLHIDTENADETSDVMINGNKGIYNLKDGIHTLVWSNKMSVFMVQTNLSYPETLKIAENVYFVE